MVINLTVSLIEALSSSFPLIYLSTLLPHYSTLYQALLDSGTAVNLINKMIIEYHRILIASEFPALPIVLTDELRDTSYIIVSVPEIHSHEHHPRRLLHCGPNRKPPNNPRDALSRNHEPRCKLEDEDGELYLWLSPAALDPASKAPPVNLCVDHTPHIYLISPCVLCISSHTFLIIPASTLTSSILSVPDHALHD